MSSELVNAARSGQLSKVQALLDAGRCGINEADDNNDNALCAAALLGHADVVEELIRRGADIRQRGRYNWTPLMTAVQCHSSSEPTRILLAALLDPIRSYSGAEIDAETNDGRQETALHVACKTFIPAATVRLLIDNGADLYKPDAQGNLAVHVAAAQGCAETLRCLLGGDDGRKLVNIAQMGGKEYTPLHLAMIYKKIECARVLVDEHAADCNRTDRLRNAPLYNACDAKFVDGVSFLIARGANLNATSNGTSALIKAVSRELTTCVRDLLRGGAQAHYASLQGNTALHAAVNVGEHKRTL